MHALSSLKKRLAKENLDALFVSKSENVSYLSGFSGHDSYLLITQGKDFFITDFRYIHQAKAQTSGFRIEEVGKMNHFDLAASLIEKNKLDRIGFEAKYISYGEVGKIRDRLSKQQFLPAYDLVEDIRVIKTFHEIKKIKKATDIALAVLNDVRQNIKPGDKENELAAFIEYQMRMRGAESASFDIIVLSGKNSTMPHGRPSYKAIGANEAVLIDTGARLDGYNSDLTRVFFLGKIPAIVRRVYDVVKKAQAMAIKAIKPGISASAVDAVARNYIQKHGWGKYFGHSLGHGIGKEVHESPWLSPKSKTILKPGMVFTVEPAVYLPGVGGIRLEEMVLVRDRGTEVLSR